MSDYVRQGESVKIIRDSKSTFKFCIVLCLALILVACDSPIAETAAIPLIHTVLPPQANLCGPSVDDIKIAGTVASGGYAGPSGVSDAPRKFEYQVETSDGEIYTITYTAYPPGPASLAEEIRLDFHAGEILIGDYLIACGTLDLDGQVVIVDKDGQFIETYSQKP